VSDNELYRVIGLFLTSFRSAAGTAPTFPSMQWGRHARLYARLADRNQWHR